MTAADMLDELALYINDLSAGAGEADETKALKAIDTAQTLFEAVVRTEANVLSREGDTPLATVANQEYTLWPAALLRVDSVWMLDENGLPSYELNQIFKSGGQARSAPWPLSLALSRSAGEPREYKADFKKFYWAPIPDAVYSLRVYGAWRGTDLTTRAIEFSYPDDCSLPICTVAARILRMGIDDPTEEVQAFANEVYRPVMKGLRKLVRSRPEPREYRYFHDT
jgi:hypothetical protein